MLISVEGCSCLSTLFIVSITCKNKSSASFQRPSLSRAYTALAHRKESVVLVYQGFKRFAGALDELSAMILQIVTLSSKPGQNKL
jgi:hypothetical protein